MTACPTHPRAAGDIHENNSEPNTTSPRALHYYYYHKHDPKRALAAVPYRRCVVVARSGVSRHLGAAPAVSAAWAGLSVALAEPDQLLVAQRAHLRRWARLRPPSHGPQQLRKWECIE